MNTKSIAYNLQTKNHSFDWLNKLHELKGGWGGKQPKPGQVTGHPLPSKVGGIMELGHGR